MAGERKRIKELLYMQGPCYWNPAIHCTCHRLICKLGPTPLSIQIDNIKSWWKDNQRRIGIVFMIVSVSILLALILAFIIISRS